MKTRHLIVLSVALAAAVGALQARVIPGRWEKVQMLPPGTEITVRLHSGERIRCSFLALTDLELEVGTESDEVRIPRSAVRKIEGAERVEDGHLNGTLIGLGVGAGGYLAAHAIVCCAPDQAHDVAGAAFYGGIGALVGYLIDDRVEKREVLYQSR